MYYVYIIYSELSGRLYIGQTRDVEARLIRHNSGRVKSTLHFRPWTLLHCYEFETRSLAMRFEKYLKSLKNKQYILHNITDLKSKFESAEKTR